MRPPANPHRLALLATVAAALAALPVLAAPSDHGRSAPRYFDIVNAAHDSVTALAIAPTGSGEFHEVDIGGPLRGGVTAITLDVPAGGCQRDLRVTFHDGRVLLYPGLDLCRHRALRLTPRDGRGDAGGTRVASSPAGSP